MTSRYLKKLYEIAPVAGVRMVLGIPGARRAAQVKLDMGKRMKKPFMGGAWKQRSERDLEKGQGNPQRNTATGALAGDLPQPGPQNSGTEIKMNRYMHALIETRKGRDRLRIGRGRRGKVTHTKPKPPKPPKPKPPKPKPPGEEGTEEEQQNDWTEYQRIGRILAEEKPQRERDIYDPDAGTPPSAARQAETGEGSDFEPGTGPKDPRDMTPEEIAALDKKTKLLIARRATQRAASMRRSGTPEPRGGRTRRS